MRRVRREKPLFTMEEICKMNGVEYDTTHSSNSVKVRDSVNNLIDIDASFNIFDNNYKTIFEFSSENIFTSLKTEIIFNDYNKTVDYKKETDISGKIKCSYKSVLNKFDNSLRIINTAV